jgi:hypothetical protein
VRRFEDCTLSQTLVDWLNQEGRDGLVMWQAWETQVLHTKYMLEIVKERHHFELLCIIRRIYKINLKNVGWEGLQRIRFAQDKTRFGLLWRR